MLRLAMSDPWDVVQEPASLGQPGGVVTLLDGRTFCISGRSGDIQPTTAQGFFHQDTRFLNLLRLEVNGQSLDPLSLTAPEPFRVTFVSRVRPAPGEGESRLLVYRHRFVGGGLREEFVIQNFSQVPVECDLQVQLDSDFAGLFEVKTGTFRQETKSRHERQEDGLTSSVTVPGRRGVGLRVSFSEQYRLDGCVYGFSAVVPPSGRWSMSLNVVLVIDDAFVECRYPDGGEPDSGSDVPWSFGYWRRSVPVVTTDYAPLGRAVSKGMEDLGGLRIFDTQYSTRGVVAAGAPWFMTLFGRDSLLASWMALFVDPDLALGTLEALARYQGVRVDPKMEEEPGKILHEIRFAASGSEAFEDRFAYYGTCDATPLFVMLLAEVRRWGLANEFVEWLLPHADRALEWIEHYGDRDGDGYVEYQRANPSGLKNQGWKDSVDAVQFADGRLAHGPIALCEVQGYVYGAYLARVHFAEEAGDTITADRFRDKAARLKQAFNRDFWVEEKGYFGLALDGDKKVVDGLSSNMGHALWTGIVDEEKAASVVRHLMSPEMFSGWGVRTLATSSAGFNPIGYHTGTVWPHDSAIAAAGMMRYGFVEEAQQVSMALLDVAETDGGRLPEVFGGIDRADIGVPVIYPTACSPQAWAAASPLLTLRTLLRFEPAVPQGKLSLAPALPPAIRRLRIEGIPLGGRRLGITVEGDHVEVRGLDPDITLSEEPRASQSAVNDVEPAGPVSE